MLFLSYPQCESLVADRELNRLQIINCYSPDSILSNCSSRFLLEDDFFLRILAAVNDFSKKCFPSPNARDLLLQHIKENKLFQLQKFFKELEKQQPQPVVVVDSIAVIDCDILYTLLYRVPDDLPMIVFSVQALDRGAGFPCSTNHPGERWRFNQLYPLLTPICLGQKKRPSSIHSLIYINENTLIDDAIKKHREAFFYNSFCKLLEAEMLLRQLSSKPLADHQAHYMLRMAFALTFLELGHAHRAIALLEEMRDLARKSIRENAASSNCAILLMQLLAVCHLWDVAPFNITAAVCCLKEMLECWHVRSDELTIKQLLLTREIQRTIRSIFRHVSIDSNVEQLLSRNIELTKNMNELAFYRCAQTFSRSWSSCLSELSQDKFAIHFPESEIRRQTESVVNNHHVEHDARMLAGITPDCDVDYILSLIFQLTINGQYEFARNLNTILSERIEGLSDRRITCMNAYHQLKYFQQKKCSPYR